MRALHAVLSNLVAFSANRRRTVPRPPNPRPSWETPHVYDRGRTLANVIAL